LLNNLIPSDAVAALIIVNKNKYLLQLRDDKSDIWFPSHWGLFGGAIEPEELPEQALIRELEEEISIEKSNYDYNFFSEFTFDFSYCGYGVVYRRFYEIHLSIKQFENLKLGEGADMNIFTKPEILNSLKITPYDQFALWMHIGNT
jgi:8-oxo-dGTP pyrophosphatase MutT (NUDIX family)